MKISIAMASYNGAIFLEDQLRSFVSQRRLPDELIVCDDVSTDGTFEILTNFAKTAPFEVSVHRNQNNLGYTKNFEQAISMSTGDLILFSDQDDVWFPHKIETLEKLFAQHAEISLIIHDGTLVDGGLEGNGVTKLGQIRSGLGSDDVFVTGALSAIRGDVVSLCFPIPEGIVGHDIWIHAVARRIDVRRIENDSLQFIRRHSSNTSEWVGSRITKIDMNTILLNNIRTRPVKSYEYEILFNRSLLERLKQIANRFPDKFSPSWADLTEENLDGEYLALLARDAMIHRRFLGRKLAATRMLLKGQYSHFRGLKSYFRDILR